MKEDFNDIISDSFETLQEFSEVFSFIAILKEILPQKSYEALVIDLFQFEEKKLISDELLEQIAEEIDNMNYRKHKYRYYDEDYNEYYYSKDEREYNRYLKFLRRFKF